MHFIESLFRHRSLSSNAHAQPRSCASHRQLWLPAATATPVPSRPKPAHNNAQDQDSYNPHGQPNLGSCAEAAIICCHWCRCSCTRSCSGRGDRHGYNPDCLRWLLGLVGGLGDVEPVRKCSPRCIPLEENIEYKYVGEGQVLGRRDDPIAACKVHAVVCRERQILITRQRINLGAQKAGGLTDNVFERLAARYLGPFRAVDL